MLLPLFAFQKEKEEQMMEQQIVLKEFEEYLKKDGKMPKTIVSYVGDIKLFLAFLNSKGVTFDGNLTCF